MPGRLTLTAEKEKLKTRYHASFENSYNPRYNISPSQLIPVILDESPDEITLARWGFKAEFMPHPIINARSENIEHNRVFGTSFRERRCLIPADSYYEWEETRDGKKPYRIMLKDKSVFSIAGVWEEVDGIKYFATITVAPNDLVKTIHERMPAIIRKEDEKKWLEKADVNLLKPYPAEEMMMYRVSTKVNSSRHDMKEYINPVTTRERQSTLI